MTTYRNSVGWITVASGIVAFISLFLLAGAVNFNFDFFADPGLIFSIPEVSPSMLKWSMIADVFGFYLMLLPVLIYVYEWTKGRTPWSRVFAICGIAYILMGAVGASILSTTWPVLLDSYPGASLEQQEVIKATFTAISMVITGGVWNVFDALVMGIWFIGIGTVIRTDNALWGWVTIVIGVISLLDSLGNILEVHALAEAAVNLYLVLAPAWALGFGMAVVQNKVLR